MPVFVQKAFGFSAVQAFASSILGNAVFASVAPAALSSLFPTRVRATGISLVYTAGITIFGGFAPAFLTYLTAGSGFKFAPAWYVTFAAAPAFVAICFLNGAARRTADG